jgi:altronate dehydratase
MKKHQVPKKKQHENQKHIESLLASYSMNVAKIYVEEYINACERTIEKLRQQKHEKIKELYLLDTQIKQQTGKSTTYEELEAHPKVHKCFEERYAIAKQIKQQKAEQWRCVRLIENMQEYEMSKIKMR